ncbi:unnamed protein product [Spirodela intermedia]|uniref:Uncharacterized protein n=1 Tax=Spirodela intermedia TaxID=51605 RepID=A0A7I8JFC9_SPIIN|nr:unnamed protein product [Spirodela intermedia]CAA6668102.1 unnamed protein product [Spirodela intermedia]
MRRRDSEEDGEQEGGRGRSPAYSWLLVVSNILVAASHLGFLAFKWRTHRDVSLQLTLPAAAWTAAGAVAICSRNSLRWPLPLSLWWAFYGLFSVASISVDIAGAPSPAFLPPPSPAGIVSFPLVAFLFFAAFFSGAGEPPPPPLKQPLIQKISSATAGGGGGTWSWLTFRWLNPVFERGRAEKLELRHLPPPPPEEATERCFSQLKECRKKDKGRPSSISHALFLAVWRPLAVNAVFAGVNTLSSYLGPYLINSFVIFLSGAGAGEPSSSAAGCSLAFLLFASKTVESLSQRQWYFGARRIGLRLRAALMAAVYRRSLFGGGGAGSGCACCGVGKATTLLDTDVERVGDFCWYLHSIWLLPVQVFLALLVLRANLGGAAAAAALLATVLVMVSNIPLANAQERMHCSIMESKDARMAATGETLKAMRILKLQAWEGAYLKKILKLREVERRRLRRYLYTCSAVAFLFWASPALVSVVAFVVAAAAGQELTAGNVLSALATFRILQEPIYNLPELVAIVAQTKVSLDRIHTFIDDDDENNQRPLLPPPPPPAAVEVEPGEYSWAGSRKPGLKIERRMSFKKGERVAVCGAVGSGKSTLLCSLLGEVTRVGCGKGVVADGDGEGEHTVRQGHGSGRYEEVVRACALDRDMQGWEGGDQAAVGERGVNLSGGQKQRIQLARAVYSGADVFFLDDPFSAVDAHTASHLFKECLMNLLAQKTVIFVTHQLEFLHAADIVLVMKEGRIVQAGKYEDLVADTDGSEFLRQMAAHESSLSQMPAAEEKHARKGCATAAAAVISGGEDELREEEGPWSKNGGIVMQEETEGGGRVKWGVYSTFVTVAYRGVLIPVILLCQVLFQGLQIGSNYWIAWAIEKKAGITRERLISVFVLLSMGSSVFVLGRAVLLATVALETAQRLFTGMITSIFRAPIAFFDSTPSSRILNRSSTDQNVVDTDIPYRLAGLVFALVQLLGIIILMSLISWVIFLLFLVVLAISYWYQTYYISTARELGRMVGIRKAPILHHFAESVAGAATIRCFNQEERFIARNLSLVDDYSRVTFHNSATMEWLSVRINFLFNLVFLIMLIFLVTLKRSSVDPSLAGLAATYGLNLNVLQAWVIWNLCNVENKMISVERILQYSRVPSEAPLVNESCRPEPSWPATGTLPLVLRGISCTFPGEKKIGVVGRTGSGKSTLIQALFRVVEPSEGRIAIDGLDISLIGLHDLRSRLSIIPQDPLLFQGTVRTNLDPLQQHSDPDIWEVLRKCHLGEIVNSDPRLLDAPVAEDGENWSVGQRQLVCLARALLKKRRILVLDEATASVDTATDNVIQKTIREETSGCTVITVAHRIPTVIDNDLVLVLDEGRIMEYDTPIALLEDRGSDFSKLVMEFLRRSRTNYQPPT